MDSSPPRRRGRLTLAERSAASGIGRQVDLVEGAATTPPAAASSSTTRTTNTTPGSDAAGSPWPPGWVKVTHPQQANPRHVWATDPPGAVGTFPGLLAQWERRPAGWWGYVVVAIPDGPDAVVVRAWMPADRLRSA